jgi:hypothetical protein
MSVIHLALYHLRRQIRLLCDPSTFPTQMARQTAASLLDLAFMALAAHRHASLHASQHTCP